MTLTKTSPSRTIALTNTGTQAVQVTLGIAPPFSIVGPDGSSKVIVLANQSQAVTIKAVSASTLAATAMATVTETGGTLCFAGPLTVHQ